MNWTGGGRQTRWICKSLSPLRRGTAGLVYGPLPHFNNLKRIGRIKILNHQLHPVGEGLVDPDTGNVRLYLVWGGDGDDRDLDKSSEEAFHPNYIPQCFSIDGSNDERFLCSFTLSNAGENRTFYFVIILFSY